MTAQPSSPHRFPVLAPWRAACVLLVPVLAGGLVAGCGATSSNGSARPAASSSWSDPAASQGAGAATDLVKHTCTASAAGAWSFTGTLKNSSNQVSDYTLTLSLVQKVGSTVVTTHEVTKQVAAGATATVEAKDFATRKDSAKLACVVSTRAKRG